jgi:hypothetical protein
MKTITVRDLRNALDRLNGDLKVWLTLPDDEWGITCITLDRTSVHLCKDNTEISVAETVLLDLGNDDELDL